jgi:phosphoribosylaminoimidazolecarboxamide formyltransferase/IMP cyclohydrolase
MANKKSKLVKNLKKINRAIISVSNKKNLNILLPILKKFGIEIISSGGSFKTIKKLGYNCFELSNYTGSPEMLDGRVKTLHPKIHAGILNIRNNQNHIKELKKQSINNIDLVIVDLYPFEEQLKNKNNFKNLIENIDIGGPTLLRGAAKNFNDVTVISNIDDYYKLVNELKGNNGYTSIGFRQQMSAKAFGQTAYYDSIISNWFNDKLKIKFPEKKTIYGELDDRLRYGENPHQEGAIYKIGKNSELKKIHGKELSYNNYNDIFSALNIIKSFNKGEGTVIIKHTNPCGASIEKDQLTSFKDALSCDPQSAFGGVLAVNSFMSKKLALKINNIFFEVIISNGFSEDAIKIFKKRKNIRLIDSSKFNLIGDRNYLYLGNYFLEQDENVLLFNKKLKVVTKKKPTSAELQSLRFAFNICKFAKSNAIVLANKKSTIGIGSGQPSRVESCKIASNKALKYLPEKIIYSVAASDAFFPFSDGINELIKVGVKAIIQPGGSINDKKVIRAADNAGIVMVFTGTRQFKH